MLLSEHARDLLAKAGVVDEEGDGSYTINHYNIAPTSKIKVVRSRSGRGKNERECVLIHWGMRRKNPADTSLLVNVRADTLLAKVGFRDALKTRRCLVPASGFFEWEKTGEARFPWLFQLKDERPFFFAGIWESAVERDVSDACSLITTEPNGVMRPVHHRMPVIVMPEDAARWLDGDVDGWTTTNEAGTISLKPLRDDLMAAKRVSRFVNNARNQGLECIAEAGADDMPDGRQGLLF